MSLEDIGVKQHNEKANILAATLDQATEVLLNNQKSPLRRAGQLDNRGSHFYLGMYWAQALADQTDDAELAAKFAPLAEAMASNETKILDEINATQSKPTDIGGYYMPDEEKVSHAMAPSETLREILATMH